MSLDSSFPLAPGKQTVRAMQAYRKILYFFPQRFSAHTSLHGKYAQQTTLEKSICAPKEYERNEKEVTQYLDCSGECFPIAVTYPSAPAPWLSSTAQVFPSQG